MGMHLFNVKQLFLRRRKYDTVLGGQQEESLDLVASPSAHKHHNTHINKMNGQHYHLNTQAQEMSSENANFKRSSAPSSSSSSSSSSILWGFKLRPKLRMRKQKSLKLASITAVPSQAAVRNFLQGPSEAKGEDEVYQQQCRDLLRKLSARGNRVPGFI